MNAFTIPAQSAIVEANRKLFPQRVKQVHRNMRPITLPGSNKNLAPAFMEKRK
jgi:hypothetical protein